MNTHELIIVGAGPAGITAGVYAARKRMKVLMIAVDVGGQASLSWDVENYLGYQFITGPELAQKFKEHLDHFDVELREGEKATSVEKSGNTVNITTDKGEYAAQTVIVASGRRPRKLGVEGEDEFQNKGITYCATCDAPLFADMDVAVIGGGNAALDAAIQLTKIAKKIYLLEVKPQLTADSVMIEKAKESGKIVFNTDTKVKKIYGDKLVQGIEIVKGDTVEDLSVGGIFVEIGSTPVSDFVQGVKKDERGEIIINCSCETDIPGIFAAGDVTNVFAKQIIVACGEGAKAAIAAFDYVNRMGGKAA
ncbi:MAG: FAD-dependent oxidoreductase [Deltaproteobacteria bacterium]|nr:FAD-dependent oxidoreductase [Deltaproteobacteria bacterium]